MHHAFLIRATVVVTLLVLAEIAVSQDTIVLKRSGRGSTLLGRIDDVSKTELTISTAGSSQKIAANEVKRLNLGGEPGGLRSGRNSVVSGQFEQALEALTGVRLDGKESRVIKEDLEFYTAFAQAQVALRGGGDPKEAVRVMLDFLRDNRDSFHYYEAVDTLGELAVALGSYDNAAKYFEELGKAPWTELKMRAKSLLARALRSSGDFDGALTTYDEVLSVGLNDAEAARQKAIATVGKAICLAELGKDKEAIQLAEQVMAANDPTDAELFAPSYIAIGTAQRKAGRLMDATLAYLHVDILYFSDRESHAEALYHLSGLWKELNRPDRSLQARENLRSRYGGTSWAKMP